jgi:hypothetical protein
MFAGGKYSRFHRAAGIGARAAPPHGARRTAFFNRAPGLLCSGQTRERATTTTGGWMNRSRTTLIVIAAVVTAGAGVWLVMDGSVGGWIRARLGIKPAIQIDFAALSGETNRSQTLAGFPGIKPHCRETAVELVLEECVAEVGKVNGVPATSITFHFDRDRLARVRVVLPAREHRAFMTEVRAVHGMWSQLDQRDAYGAALVAWSLPGGRLAMSEDVATAPETVVQWTSKAGLFRDAVREIGQLIQSEAGLTHVTATVQAQAGARQYDTTSPFRRSFRRVRAVPNDQNAQLIEWLSTNAETVPSPLLLELAQRLLATDANEAMRWHATFRLLMAFDAARCSDPTAGSGRSGAAVLALYPSLTRFAEEHPAVWREATVAARNWAHVRQIRSNPMWLCASGMRAVRVNTQGQPQPVSVRELLLPESSWPAAWRDVLARASR